MTACNTYIHGDNEYEITYNIARIKMYERGRKPIMSTFIQNGGSFSFEELADLIAAGLKVVDGNFVSPKLGVKIADELIAEEGYLPMYQEVTEALERDCGFFFKGISID